MDNSTKLSSVLLEYDDSTDVYSSSGFLFSNRYILAPSNIFLTTLNRTKHFERWTSKEKFGDLLLVDIPEIRGKIRALKSRTDFQNAEITAAFYCKNIAFSTPKVLGDWCVDTEDTDKQLKNALALFVILEIDKNYDVKTDLTNLKQELYQLLLICQGMDIKRGGKIYTESTPFGNRNFVNSLSAGIISNIVGDNDCFMLIDAPTVPGSEGGPVYGVISQESAKGEKCPIGIILASLTWWRGEYVGLSLTAKLQPLLVQLFPKELIQFEGKCKPIIARTEKCLERTLDSELNCIDSSFVQVFCGSGWGTGIVLDVNKGIIITNSHVVINNNIYEVKIQFKNNVISCNVLYKTPDEMVFDIAVLQCNPDDLKKYKIRHAKMAIVPAHKGEDVVAAGFPFFSQSVSELPTISCGNISEANSAVIKTTCSIHPGASGGGILRKNGEVLGIIVCNTRLNINSKNIIYPNINMAIPWLAIADLLQDYLETENYSVLNNLCTRNIKILQEWTLHTASKL